MEKPGIRNKVCGPLIGLLELRKPTGHSPGSQVQGIMLRLLREDREDRGPPGTDSQHRS